MKVYETKVYCNKAHLKMRDGKKFNIKKNHIYTMKVETTTLGRFGYIIDFYIYIPRENTKAFDKVYYKGEQIEKYFLNEKQLRKEKLKKLNNNLTQKD